nr:unnamed protein product [Digitaria exilis]
MLTSSLKHFKSVESVQKDFLEAKHLAAQLVLDILDSVVPHENRILVKLLETFEIELRDIAHALHGSELDDDLVKAREHLRHLVKKFAEKGCWDIAEVRAKKDTKLLEYLVCLAMEAGYMEKVDELCQRYSLEGYVNSLVPEKVFCGSDYLDLKKLDVEEIVWVDEVNGLLNATSCLEACKIIGMDCEWRPNFEKNSKPSKKEYAALDAVVLVHIFHEHIRRQPQFGISEGCKAEWKSHVVSRVNSTRNPLRL